MRNVNTVRNVIDSNKSVIISGAEKRDTKVKMRRMEKNLSDEKGTVTAMSRELDCDKNNIKDCFGLEK